MLLIAGNHSQYCPYRDCLGIDTSGGRISWYQLLSASADATPEELLHRWGQRRILVTQKRTESGNPLWDDVLDELDRALACLSHARKKADYDDDLARRSRQTSLIRHRSSFEQSPLEGSKAAGKVEGKNKWDETTENAARRRFEPLREMGRGPHGTRVFEAYEFTLKRTVAVKCLEKAARTESRCRSFLDEARFLASISHSNLVEVHLVNEKSRFFVLEFLPKTVREHFQIEREGLAITPDQVIEFLRQALSVLQCLHERGVVHGAVSLKSFLVSDPGVIKLIDAPGCTRAGLFRSPVADQFCVAPELLSPETFGEPKAPVDLYMIGHAAIELLAGDKLSKWFRKISTTGAPDQRQWLRWHASPLERMPSLEQFVTDIPTRLTSVIEKLCEKQVVDRYRTAADALSDLVPPEKDPAKVVKRDPNQSTNRRTAVRSGTSGIAGEPPLTVPAKSNEEPASDLITILQDPGRLWTAFRSNRNLQLTAGFALTAIIAVMLLPSGKATEFAVNVQVVPETVPDRSVVRADDKITDDTRKTGLKKPHIDAGSVVIPPKSFPNDLRPIPVVARATQRPVSLMTEMSKHESARLQSAVACPFVMDLKKPHQFAVMQRILMQLKNAKSGDERKQLLEKARTIAPNDPRASFIFAATYEFSAAAKEELRESVILSGPKYTQPFRKSIESLLRGPSNECKTADTVLAELIRFRSQLNSNELSPPDIYDWEWIGRILGYLEALSSENAPLKSMLAANLPRICEENPPEVNACIERGQRSIRLMPESDRSAASLFPPQPQVEIGLCIESLIPTNSYKEFKPPAASFATASLPSEN